MKKLIFSALLLVAVGWVIGDSLFGFTDKDSEVIEIPRWVGLDEDEITPPEWAALTVEYKHDAATAHGVVMEQDPPGGAKRKLGTGRKYNIRLTVSMGAEEAEVPAVGGMDAADAATLLRQAGFVVQQETLSNSGAAPGSATKTEPPSGVSLPLGSTVVLFVAAAPATESISVPNLVGMTREAALFQLYLAGLKADTVTSEASAAPIGIVIRQSPAPGSLLPPGASVRLVVSDGEQDGSQ